MEVGSKTFDGVQFQAYPDDHPPAHVHGFYAGIEVIVDLRDNRTFVSGPKKAVKPNNAPLSDVRHVLEKRRAVITSSRNCGRHTMANAAVGMTDEEIEAVIYRSSQEPDEPFVKTIDYAEDLDLLVIPMSNGLRLPVPIENLEGLENATPAQIRNYELHGPGYGFGFPDLDADFYLPALLKGISGFPQWMSMLGKGGAETRSESRRAAYRENAGRSGKKDAAA